MERLETLFPAMKRTLIQNRSFRLQVRFCKKHWTKHQNIYRATLWDFFFTDVWGGGGFICVPLVSPIICPSYNNSNCNHTQFSLLTHKTTMTRWKFLLKSVKIQWILDTFLLFSIWQILEYSWQSLQMVSFFNMEETFHFYKN